MHVDSNLSHAKKLLNESKQEKKEKILCEINDITQSIDTITSEIQQYKEILEKNQITEDDQRLIYKGNSSNELKQIWDISEKLKTIETAYSYNVKFLITCCVGFFLFSTTFIKMMTNKYDMIIITTVFIILNILCAVSLIKLSNKRSNIYTQLQTMVNNDMVQLHIDITKYQTDITYSFKIVPSLLRDYVMQRDHIEQKQYGLAVPHYSFIVPDHKRIVYNKYLESVKSKEEQLIKLQSLMSRITSLDKPNPEE